MDYIQIRTTFPLDESIRITNKNMKEVEEQNTIADIARGINIIAWNKQVNYILNGKLPRYISSVPFIRICNSVIESLVLEDENSNALKLEGRGFHYDTYNEVSYIYGEITEAPYVAEKNTYIHCKYIENSGKEKKATFCTTNSSYEKVKNQYGQLTDKQILFGLCVRKKIAPYSKKRYDKYSHMTYVSSSTEERDINKLIQFCILSSSNYGLICSSTEEAECLDTLCAHNEYFKRTAKPYGEYGYAPTAIVMRKDGLHIMEAISSRSQKEQEERQHALEKLKDKGISYTIYSAKGGGTP